MSSITVSKITHEVFGNLAHVSNGTVEFMATLDFGPRIIHLSLVGKENMFFQNLDKESFDKNIFNLYGGHRLWISPELDNTTYYPDNFPVECKEIENGVILTAPVETTTCIQKSIILTFTDDNKIEAEHLITNKGVWDILLAPWSLSVMAGGGLEIIPNTKRNLKYLGNRALGLWPYTKMNDKRVYWGDDFITLTHDASMSNPFKIGINNEDGWAAYFNKSQIFIKHYEHEISGTYPDFGICSYQTYTCSNFTELETVGQYQEVAPEETVSHLEQWELYAADEVPPHNDEDQINAVMKKYI